MEKPLLSVHDQSRLRDEWLATRLSTVVPAIMERAGIDCWVLVAREYNEDPVVATMLPATWLNARRRTILVFTAYGAERIAIARYAVGSAFPAGWSPEDEPDQWKRLAAYLEEKNPQRIAVNVSDTFALADGFSASEFEQFQSALSTNLHSRVVPTDELAIGWLETRTPDEMSLYPEVCSRAHAILRRALSPEVIDPGTTTTNGVEWWLRQEVADRGYDSWFHPTVSVQRNERAEQPGGFAARPEGKVILPGDLVHIDFGIVYLGLHTDQQQHAYVLQPPETSAPEGIADGMAKGNRLQDILAAAFVAGRTGNDVLAAARAEAVRSGLNATIYTHPIGLHGHAAGPTIGLWDMQGGVAGAGDYPVWPDTAYSIELNVEVSVPEWNDQPVRIMLEEDAFFDGEVVRFMDGRQTNLWLV